MNIRWLAVATSVLVSCQSVQPSNPYDPDTPGSEKATASLVGTIEAEAADVGAITVSLPELGISRTPDAAGHFEILDIQSGLYLIEVVAAGHAGFRDTRYFPVGGRVILELTLAAHRGALRGSARLEGESRHAGIVVVLAGAQPPPVPGRRATGPATPEPKTAAGDAAMRTALTDGSGNYSLPDVPVGTYSLAMEKEGFARAGVAAVTVSAKTVTDVEEVTLKPVTGAVDVFGGPDFDTPDYDNEHYSRTQEVRLRVYGFNAAEMKISESEDLAGAVWEEYATERSWTLSDSDGAKTLYVRLRDGEGNESEVLQGHTVLDRVPPEAGEHSLVIDGGAVFSADTSGLVDLALDAGDATSGTQTMWISTDPDLQGAAKQGYGERVPGFRVASGDVADDGLKTVYARFGDAAGNLSDVASAQIYLDRQPPANAAVSVDGLNNGYARVRPPLLLLAADEPCDDEYPGGCNGGITVPAEVQLSESDAFAHAAWQPFSEFVGFDLSPGDGDKTVHVRFRDGAGNISLATSASFVLDTVVPSGPSVLIEGGADFVNSADVALSLYCEGADEMILGDSPDFGAADWVPYADTASFDLLGGDGLHTVYARFRDTAGNLSEVTLDSVELDTGAPVIPDTGLNVADLKYDGIDYGFTDRAAVTVFIQASGAEAMRLSTRADFADASWEAFASSAAVLLPADGVNTVYLCVRDGAGNQSCEFAGGGTAMVQTLLDTAAPFAPLMADVAQPVVAEDQITLVLDAASTDPGEGATGAFLTHQVRGGAHGDWTDVADVSGGLSFDLSTGDGDYLLEVRGKDRAGNVSAADVVQVSRDTVAPPTPVLRQGAEPPVVNQEIYSVMLDPAAAERPTDDPHFSHYEMIGGQLGEWTFTAATDSFPFLLVQGNPTPSSNTLTVRAVDQAGNVSGEASITVIEDSVPPTPPELYSAGGTVVADWVPLSLSSPGSDDYPSHYEVLGGEYLNFTNVGSYEHFNPVQGQQDFRIPLRPNRRNDISVVLVDKAGNSSYPAFVAVEEQRYALVGEVTAQDMMDPQLVADHSLIAINSRPGNGGTDVGFWWADGRSDPFRGTTSGCGRNWTDHLPPVALDGTVAAFANMGVFVADVAAEDGHLSAVAGGSGVKGLALWGHEGAYITSEPTLLVHTPPGEATEESQGTHLYGVIYEASQDTVLRSISVLVTGECTSARLYREWNPGSGEFEPGQEGCLHVPGEVTTEERWVTFDFEHEDAQAGTRLLIGVELQGALVNAAATTASDPDGGTLQRGVWFDNPANPEDPLLEANLHDLTGLPFVRAVTEPWVRGEKTRSIVLFGAGADGVHGDSDDTLSVWGRIAGDRMEYTLLEEGAAMEAEAAEGNRGYLLHTPDEPEYLMNLDGGIPLSCSGPASFTVNAYESETLDGEYSLVYTHTSDPESWGGGLLNYYDMQIDTRLQPNRYYYVAISWSGPCATNQSAGALPVDTAVGTWSCPVRDKDLGGTLHGGSGSAPDTLTISAADCAATTTPLYVDAQRVHGAPRIAGMLRGKREVVWAEVSQLSAEIRYLQADASGDFSGAALQPLASAGMLTGDSDSVREFGFDGSDRYVCWTDFLEADEQHVVRCYDRGEDLLLGTTDDPAGNPVEVIRMDLPFLGVDGMLALSVYQDRLAVMAVVMPRYYLWVHDIPTGERVAEIPLGPQTLDIELTGDLVYILEASVENKLNLYRHSFSRNKWLVTSEQGEEYLPSLMGDRYLFARGTGDLLTGVPFEYDPETASAQPADLGVDGGFMVGGEMGKYYLVSRLPPDWGLENPDAHQELGLYDAAMMQYTPLNPNLNTSWPVSSAEIDGNRVVYQHTVAPGLYDTILLDLVDDEYGNGDDVLLNPAFTASGDSDPSFELALGGNWIVQTERWSGVRPVWVHDIQNGTTDYREDLAFVHLWAIHGDLLIHTIEDEPGFRLTQLPLAPTPESFTLNGSWFEYNADYRPMRHDGSRFLMFADGGGGWPIYLDTERRTAVVAGADLVSQMDLALTDIGISNYLSEGQFVYGQQGPFTTDLFLYEVGEVF